MRINALNSIKGSLYQTKELILSFMHKIKFDESSDKTWIQGDFNPLHTERGKENVSRHFPNMDICYEDSTGKCSNDLIHKEGLTIEQVFSFAKNNNQSYDEMSKLGNLKGIILIQKIFN